MKKFLANNYVIIVEVIVILGVLYWYFFDNGGTESIITGISALGMLASSIISKLSIDKNQSAKVKVTNKAKVDKQVNIGVNKGKVNIN